MNTNSGSRATGLRRARWFLVVVGAVALLAPVALALGATINGGGTSQWFVVDDLGTSNGLPAGGSLTLIANRASISDAQIPGSGDAFDGGGMVWVADTQVGGPLSVVGQRATFGTSNIASLQVSLEYFFLTTRPVARVIVTLHNPTAGDIAVPVDYATNFGSDGGTAIRGSSSGDLAFAVADRWLVTSDASDGDPVNTTVLFGPGPVALIPSSVSSVVFSSAGTEGARARFDVVNVPAGQTRHLMFFQELTETSAGALAGATTYDSSALTPEHHANRPPSAEILNWAFDPVAPTVTASVQKTLLWPATNGLMPVGLQASASDNIDPVVPLQPVEVYSDEADAGGIYSPDATAVGLNLRLRAERTTPGNGRVYLIVVRAVDSSGNVGFDCLTVVAPVNLTVGHLTALQADAAAAAAFCEANGGAPPPGFVRLL
jgi:hypothetical protein